MAAVAAAVADTGGHCMPITSRCSMLTDRRPEGANPEECRKTSPKLELDFASHAQVSVPVLSVCPAPSLHPTPCDGPCRALPRTRSLVSTIGFLRPAQPLLDIIRAE